MAKTASNNGRKNTSQSRKTNTQGKKTTAQGRKKQTKKNVQTQADQLKNDCIILRYLTYCFKNRLYLHLLRHSSYRTISK